MSKFKVGDRVMTNTGDGAGTVVDVDDIQAFPYEIELDFDGEIEWFADYEMEAVK